MTKLSLRYSVVQPRVVILFVIALALLMLNAMLVQQNKQLKVYASRMNRSLELAPGTEVSALSGLDASGNNVAVEYGKDPRKTLLLIMSPACPSCGENMKNWELIAEKFDPSALRLFGVSLHSEGTDAYVSHYQLHNTPFIADLNPKSRVAYNLIMTPQMILVDASGKVEHVWTGVLEKKDKEEVEQYLGIHLP